MKMPFHHLQRKILLTTCLIIVILYLKRPPDSGIFKQFYYYWYPTESIQCYRIKTDETLSDISDERPAKGRSIFFHETSCSSYLSGKISITARQACAVESAAKLNPNYEVHLLFASPGTFKFEGTESDGFLQVLLNYTNVKIHHVDYGRYTRDTPVEILYKNGKIDWSKYAQSHASDVLRYLTLWKYGGIYLDLDVVVIKSLEGLSPNFAGSESDRHVAAGVLNFSPDGLGHALAGRCLEDLRNNFKGDEWGYNGPGVITRLLKVLCGVDMAKDMVERRCRGFKVFPVEAFYPVGWEKWQMYFNEDAVEAVFNMSKNSYVVHVWNRHSVQRRISIISRTPYALLARRFCPNVFRLCREFF